MFLGRYFASGKICFVMNGLWLWSCPVIIKYLVWYKKDIVILLTTGAPTQIYYLFAYSTKHHLYHIYVHLYIVYIFDSYCIEKFAWLLAEFHFKGLINFVLKHFSISLVWVTVVIGDMMLSWNKINIWDIITLFSSFFLSFPSLIPNTYTKWCKKKQNSLCLK